MSDIENLIIENYPKIDILKMTITTEFLINPEQEISISINNAIILSRADISEVNNNIIELVQEIELKENDAVVVIYTRQI